MFMYHSRMARTHKLPFWVQNKAFFLGVNEEQYSRLKVTLLGIAVTYFPKLLPGAHNTFKKTFKKTFRDGMEPCKYWVCKRLMYPNRGFYVPKMGALCTQNGESVPIS